MQAGNFTTDHPSVGDIRFVVYEDDWPLRAFKTMEAARQWAQKNCRPHEYEIRSGGNAVKDAMSLEQVINTAALW